MTADPATPDADFWRQSRSTTIGRAVTLPANTILVESSTTKDGLVIQTGDTVELCDGSEAPLAFRNGDFLKVKHIFRDPQSKDDTLRGLRLRRNYQLQGMLPRKLNEVCIILDAKNHDKRPSFEQGMVDVALSSVIAKRDLIITNQPFPALRQDPFMRHDPALPGKFDIFCSGRLVCRWVCTLWYKQTANENKQRLDQGELATVTEREADTAYGVPAEVLLLNWQGSLPTGRKPFTLFDACCGCGGVSCGATQAGYDVKFGVDWCRRACDTFTLNQPQATTFQADISNLSALNEDLRVDVVHVSTSCTVWSPANTLALQKDYNSVGGQKDEANSASIFAIPSLLTTTRARVLTLEQTNGIVTMRRNNPWFRALIAQFTTIEYSVRWKVLNFADFGLPQKRKRLILFASCPGGILPQFPKPTHGPGTNQPWTTIHDGIVGIQPSAKNHVPKFFDEAKTPYNARSQLHNLIATSGTLDYHPDGKRKFTIREMACLMTFPMDFAFASDLSQTHMKRQIGNAVPPRVYKTLLLPVTAALKQENRKWEELLAGTTE